MFPIFGSSAGFSGGALNRPDTSVGVNNQLNSQFNNLFFNMKAP